MDGPIAVAHYPEGKGHATRMLAVGRALEARGATVAFAGGGPGSELVETYGYDVFRPTAVDFVEGYQYGSLRRTVGGSVPRSCERVVDYLGWFDRRSPSAVVTDDMFAAVAASLRRLPLYVLTHNAPSLYDAVLERVFTWLLTRYQRTVAREFFYPAVWPPTDGDPRGVRRVPPVALEAPAGTAPTVGFDVLLVPSVYSRNFEALADALRADGHEVTVAGGPEWTPVPALLPWIRAAAVVVCSGYSTVMEAAVAGTPCVLYPFTDEQHGVAWNVERAGLQGFQVEHSVHHVVRAVRHPPEPPDYENGTDRVAEGILGAPTEGRRPTDAYCDRRP